MTPPLPLTPVTRRTFFSRRFAPLVTTWIVAIIVAGLIYWFETTMPAFHDVVAPLYVIIAVLTVFFTWRWIRTRGRKDRRNIDRRRTDRRNTAEYTTKPPEP